MPAMRKLVVGLALVAAGSGCYGSVGYRGNLHIRANPVAAVATAVAVTAIVAAVNSQPPVVANVEYYDYGYNPGHVWVNGRYTYVNNQWVWNAGYWQPERTGYYWVQGAWQPQGNQWVWVDGHWEAPRNGYTYIDGYWDYQSNGYVWVPGTWEVERPGHVYIGGTWTVVGGRRTWARGRWERDDGRPEWGRYRTRGRVIVRDHR
jgi:WXXGXW repeat (2 copies)